MDKVYIGVDVGGTSIKLGIVDDTGKVLTRREIKYVVRDGSPSVIKQIRSGIRQLISEERMSDDDLGGIGVSAAGCINSVKGSVAENGGNIPGWSHTEVAAELREEFDMPVTLANDANCAVLGEVWAGAAEGYTDVLGITIGTGIGGGVITGGRLLEGSRGYAGELGHFPTHAGGNKCVCGIEGCYERYASTSSLIRKTSEADPSWDSGRTFFTAAAAGDKTALAILDEWITEIAYGLAGYIHVFDPQIVLIGGGVSKQEDLLIRPLKEKVLSLVMPDFASGIEFRSAELGNDAGIVGAVYYLLSKQKID